MASIITQDVKKCEAMPRVQKSSVIGETKWLRLLELEYSDENNTIRSWNMAQRTTKSKEKDAVDAVAIFAILKGGSDGPKTILVRQFRPPMNKYCIELPAGLIDKNETFEEAALRELKEETGYVGSVKNISPPCNMSPGMSDETVCIVEVVIDMTDERNKKPITEFDDGECVETIIVKLNDVGTELKRRSNNGDSVCAVVWSMYMGLAMRYNA
jgi:8-oxo-dGTP pyrophosphatase MutT (NUDIX family)